MSVDEDGTVYVGRTAQARGGLRIPLIRQAYSSAAWSTDREYRLGQRTFRAEELSSLVLRSLKEDAEAFLGRPVGGYPQCTRLFQRCPTQGHPAAQAACRFSHRAHYQRADRCRHRLRHLRAGKKNGCYLVFDLGGGTLDVSILELYESIMEVHAVAGDNYLGGEDFTNVVQQLFLQKNSLTWDELALRSSSHCTGRRIVQTGAFRRTDGRYGLHAQRSGAQRRHHARRV